MLNVLGNRTFRHLFAAQLIALIGTGLATVALGLLAWQLGALVFVAGWLFQFVGHYWEGRKPAFVDDTVGLLVGPMFVVGEALMLVGLLGGMRRQIEAEAGPTR